MAGLLRLRFSPAVSHLIARSLIGPGGHIGETSDGSHIGWVAYAFAGSTGAIGVLHTEHSARPLALPAPSLPLSLCAAAVFMLLTCELSGLFG